MFLSVFLAYEYIGMYDHWIPILMLVLTGIINVRSEDTKNVLGLKSYQILLLFVKLSLPICKIPFRKKFFWYHPWYDWIVQHSSTARIAIVENTLVKHNMTVFHKLKFTPIPKDHFFYCQFCITLVRKKMSLLLYVVSSDEIKSKMCGAWLRV
jgi:hypothetical protein